MKTGWRFRVKYTFTSECCQAAVKGKGYVMMWTAKLRQLTESSSAQRPWRDCEGSCGSARGAWLLLSRTGRGTWEGSSGGLAALLLSLVSCSPEHHVCHLERKRTTKKLFSGIVYSNNSKGTQIQNILTFKFRKSLPETERPHWKRGIFTSSLILKGLTFLILKNC